MKKVLIVILLLLLTIASVQAYDSKWRIKLEKVSVGLVNEQNITTWINQNVNYNFYYYPRDLQSIWQDLKGDCSDMNSLAQFMLAKNGIKAIKVHGWCYVGKEKFKHDYLEIG